MTLAEGLRACLRPLPIFHRWEYINSMGQQVSQRLDWVRRTCRVCYRCERSSQWK